VDPKVVVARARLGPIWWRPANITPSQMIQGCSKLEGDTYVTPSLLPIAIKVIRVALINIVDA
jgi:hypothetical protein